MSKQTVLLMIAVMVLIVIVGIVLFSIESSQNPTRDALRSAPITLSTQAP